MKKLVFILLFSIFTSYAQDTITATFTGDEEVFSGEYTYVEMENDKKVFSRTVEFEEGFELTALVIYLFDEDLDTYLWSLLIDGELVYISSVTPESVMPPFEGWESVNDDSTLSIYYEPENDGDIVVMIPEGDCSAASGVYHLEGLLNDKNRYLFPIDYDGDAMIVEIGFDGVDWKLYIGDFSNAGFVNNNVSTSVLPPNNGWVNVEDGCTSEELIIEGGYNIAVSKEELEKVVIYPNPVNSTLFIDGANMEDYQVFDISGHLVLQGSYFESINVSNLDNGIYFLKNESGSVKFIKQ